MEYKVETSLENFEAWSGGKDTLEVLIDKGDCEKVEQYIEECFYDGEMPTETTINDFLWFERDFIAINILGYDSWEAYEYGGDDDEDEEEEEEEEYEDVNGRIIKVGDRVYWDDEAGVEEDGTKIVFIVDEADGNGYFNIHTDNEDFADRWAYYSELEVIE